jgi:hypothetical protein
VCAFQRAEEGVPKITEKRNENNANQKKEEEKQHELVFQSYIV